MQRKRDAAPVSTLGNRNDRIYLGLEAGGTRTVARAEDRDAGLAVEREFGPANLRLLDDAALVRHFQSVAKAMPAPSALAIGMAGARTPADLARIRAAAAAAWPKVPCHPTNDLETALMAADDLIDHPRFRSLWRRGPGRRRTMDGREADRILQIPRVLILSGTGSCCFGRAWDGRTAKVGGWGHILGDKGSAFEIGLRGLKAVVYYHDRDGEWSELGQRILRTLMLNEPNDLIDWVLKAGKDDVARIALEVFHAWDRRDAIAADILTGAAHSLAKDAAACARRLLPKGGPVQFILAGGVLLKQPRFARKVAKELAVRWPEAIVTPLQRSGVEGAVELARAQFPPDSLPATAGVVPLEAWIDRPSSARARAGAGAGAGGRPVPAGSAGGVSPGAATMPGAPADEIRSRAQSPTEQRNPRSTNLDRLSIGAAVELMLSEDARIPDALRAERRGITRAIERIVRSFQKGGRLFYVGAGTSGRLGVLDASECPPTFRTDPEQVQGIIAGGQTALWSAVEGAEDDPAAGARAIAGRGVSARDTVVGIAASGRTPYVWGALDEARRRGASTVLVCFNPHLIIPRHRRPDIVIAPAIGPEVLTGSTRLKSGTATKLILNLFTTLAMVRTGKVLSNLMVDVKASNVKLRDRAARIVQELTGLDYDAARAALMRHEWKIPETCAALRSPTDRTRNGARRRRS